ncbi:MAG TPA: ABC transporter permease [Gemmatimonadota bacterium]|nr:ABC transporter permease [Gemmatimonadota bacterium]
MSTPSNVLADLQSRSEAMAPAEISPLRRLVWSVRRELWENRSIYLAPLAVAALFLAGFLVALVRLPHTVRAASALGPIQRQAAIEQPYVIAAIMLMAIAMLVAVFYCVDALYGERRDRSTLFWKSLPVSDWTTVLSKASIPILVLPLVTFAVTVVTQFVMLLASSAVLAASGLSVRTLWSDVPFFEISGIHLSHIVGFHGIWWAPIYGWLLLVSAWAKRAPFLWATLPPVAIGAAERIAFGTSHFSSFLQNHFLGGPITGGSDSGMSMDMLGEDPWGWFLLDPGLYVGLAVTAAFLLAAVWLRRWRGPI